jgi:hypothetical protein
MLDNIPTVYGLWGGLAALLALQFLWIHFVAYPAHFERMLRRGRGWVYIPLRWKGFYKFQVQLVTRISVIAVALLTLALMIHYTGNRKPLWVAAYVGASYVAASWIGSFWTRLRYRQQEDAYFLQLDELRAKLEQENKDYSDVQLRNLSAYQHQQKLHRADEEGKFLAVLREEARRFRKAKLAPAPALEA